jgi:tetratricopeptide (TPR) repeat protein
VLDLWNSVSDSQIGNSGGLFDEWYSNEIASMGEEHRGREIERLRSVDAELQDELSWAGVAEWLARAEARARLLAERNGPADQEECRSLAHRVESLVIRRIGSVTAADWLAAWQTGMQAQVFASRVFEGFSELVGRCVKIMEFGSDPGMAQRAFTQVSTFSRSAYHFYFAGVLHGSGQGSIQSALEHLEQAIELNPQESTLYFFKGLWIQGALLVASALGGAADGLSAVDARLCFQRASELDPEWTEPKWELGKLEGK